ncbi:MAG: porin [Rickettsiales bacterium]|nr:porin [Rickettsiales bacterium]
MLKKIQKLILLVTFQFVAYSSNAQIIPEEEIVKTPIIKFKGTTNSSFALKDQSSGFKNKLLPDGVSNNRYNNKFGANNNSQFFINADFKSSNIKYGVTTKLETELSSDQNRGRVDIDQAFAFADSDYGKLEFGNATAVNQKMKVGPASFVRGNGGINGNYLKYVNLPTFNNSSVNSNVKTPSFILVPQSPIGHGGYAQSFYDNDFNKNRLRIIRDKSFKGAEDALKINYYTPRVEGFQFGASYTYDTSKDGLATTIFGNSATAVKNVLSLGANYSGDLDNLGYAVSLTAENGQIKQSQFSNVQRNNLSSYDVATTLSYFGFSFGASYGYWGNSLQQKNGQNSCNYDSSLTLYSQNCSLNSSRFRGASYYTYGMAYGFGPVGASVTALQSNFQKNKYQAISLDIDYKFKRDLIPYFEITEFEFKSNQIQASDIASNQIQDNKGFVALVGFVFNF